jgi:hypothetical protein
MLNNIIKVLAAIMTDAFHQFLVGVFLDLD